MIFKHISQTQAYLCHFGVMPYELPHTSIDAYLLPPYQMGRPPMKRCTTRFLICHILDDRGASVLLLSLLNFEQNQVLDTLKPHLLATRKAVKVDNTIYLMTSSSTRTHQVISALSNTKISSNQIPQKTILMTPLILYQNTTSN